MTWREDLPETQDAYCGVTHIQMDVQVADDQAEFRHSTLVHIWNEELHKGTFKDMKNNSEVLDLQIKEQLHQQFEVDEERLLRLQ